MPPIKKHSQVVEPSPQPAEATMRRPMPQETTSFKYRRPLGECFTAADGAISQLWADSKYGLVASTLEADGTLRIAAGEQVHNALQPGECGNALLAKLAAAGPRPWGVVFLPGKPTAHVWPQMSAAGSTDHYAFAPPRFNPMAGNDNDITRAERYLAANGFELRAREAGGGTAWYQRSTGRLAQVFPENSAVPARVVVTLRGFGVDVERHAEPHNRSYIRQATREAVREQNREYDGHRYDQPSGKRFAEGERVDLGHRPGAEFRNGSSFHARMGTSRSNFSAEQNRSLFYQEERPAANRGHGWELPSAQYIAGGTPLLMQDGRPMVAIMYQLNPTDARWALVAAYRDYMYSSARAGSFEQYLQMAGLLDGYNRQNPGRPFPTLGAGFRPVGGVEFNVGEIKELRTALEGIKETDHVFCIPAPDGRAPFSNAELQQLMRELATGVFVHDIRPMFSLHFNQDAKLYPVIPPEYANTLVGRVMGMLDYMMKGYLNGGLFDEAFVEEWLRKGQPDTQSSLNRLIDLRREYATIPETLPYRSLRQIMRAHGVAEGEDSRGLTSSFRIIADNPVVFANGSFLIGDSFRVEYTIEGTPEFNEYRRQHIALHGCEPPEYRQLDNAYQEMAREIRFNMPKLPPCRKLFKMLGVIHFFTQYFVTLKATQKVPFLPAMITPRATTFPSALPPLPILDGQNTPQSLTVNWTQLGARLPDSERQAIERDFLQALAAGTGAVVLQEAHQQLLEQAFIDQVRQSIAVEGAMADAGLPNKAYAQAVTMLLQALAEAYRAEETAAETAMRRLRNALNTVTTNERTERSQLDDYVRRGQSTINQTLRDQRARIERQKRTLLDGIEAEAQRALRALPSAAARARANTEVNRWRQSRRAEVEATVASAYQDLNAREAQVRNQVAAEQTAERTRLQNAQIDRRNRCEGSIREVEAVTRRLRTPMSMLELTDNVEIDVQAPVTVLHTGGAERELSGVRTRVVGGCVLDFLKNSPRHFASAEILQTASRDLSTSGYERLTPVDRNGDRYHLFKLGVQDAVSMHGGDYSWMDSLLIRDANLLWDDATWNVISSILAGDAIAVRDALTASTNVPALLKRGDASGMTPIHYAATHGSARIIHMLVKEGADVNLRSFTDVTPLHLAASAGREESIQALLSAGAKRDARTPYGATALHLAVEADNLPAVNVLTRNRAQINTCMGNGMQPLHTAVLRGNLEMVEALKKSSADIEAAMADEARPMHLAASLGRKTIVEALLRAGARPEVTQRNGMTALHLAASRGHAPTCEALLGRLSMEQINKALPSGQTALHLAATQGHVRVVAALLRAGADAHQVDGTGEDALMAAIRSGHVSAALLLVKRAQVRARNNRGETAAVLAAKYGFWEVVDALVTRRASLRFLTLEHRWNIVHCLCRQGDNRRLALFFDHGFISIEELSAQDRRGFSPACIALQHGHDGIIALFKARGWNPAWPIGQALDKIHWAAFAGCMELLRPYVAEQGDLLRIVTDADSKHCGKSLAYLAAEGGHSSALRLLLKAGAPLHYDVDGETKSVTLAAVRGGSLAAANAALHYHDDIHAPLERTGLTLIQLAARQGDMEMVKLLKSYGTRLDKAPSRDGWALHEAVRGDFEALIELLVSDELALPSDIVPFTVEYGSENALRKILERDPDIHAKNDAGETSVMVAVRTLKTEQLHLLLEGGADPTAISDPNSPLTLAAREGNLAAVQLLVEANVPLDTFVAGHTALQRACASGHMEVVQYLMARGANAELRTDDGKTCYRLASDHPEIQLCLGQNKNDLQTKKRAMYQALGARNVDAIRAALQDLPLQVAVSFEPGDNPTPVSHALIETKDAAIIGLLTPTGMEVADASGLTAIHVAAQLGYVELIPRATLQGVDLDLLDNRGRSPLFHAVVAGHGAFVKGLLGARRAQSQNSAAQSPIHDEIERCVDANRRDVRGVTAAHLAALRGDHDTLCTLISAGCDADFTDRSGMTPLAYAIESTSRACAVSLLEAGANIHALAGPNRDSYLQLAATKGALEIVLELLARGARVDHANAKGLHLIHTAARHADGGLLNVLLGAHPEEANRATKDGLKPVHFAAMNPKISALKVLLEAAADPNEGSSVTNAESLGSLPPAHLAAMSNNIPALDLLYEAGADLGAIIHNESALDHAQPSTARTMARKYPALLDAPNERAEVLVQAARGGDLQAVREFVKVGALPNGAARGGKTPIMAAAESGHTDVLAALINLGGDATSAPSLDDLPIFLATREGHVACVRLLLNSGNASATAVDSEGKSLIHLAVEAGRPGLVTALVSQMGLDINMTDNAGRSPLTRALELRAGATVKLLVLLGAQVSEATLENYPAMAQSLRDWQGHPGDTPVARAARWGDAVLLDTLLKEQEPDMRNEAGERPLQLCHDAACARLLLESGAAVTLEGDSAATPLLNAVKAGSLAQVQVLLSYGAPVAAPEGSATNPIYEAFQQGSRVGFKALLASAPAHQPRSTAELRQALSDGNLISATQAIARGGLPRPGDAATVYSLVQAAKDDESQAFVTRWLDLPTDRPPSVSNRVFGDFYGS